MSSHLKVLTVVGTRPEIIKLSRVMAELERSFDHVLVHTGQNYDAELSSSFFEELGISRPKHHLAVAAGNPADTIAQVISSVDRVLAEERPDAFLVYGDTNSCLAALPAKRRRVPVFHMEAGNRCFDQRVPEEINRKIIDHISDINMTNSEHARRYLLAEGLRPETVFLTGSPMEEVIEHYRPLRDDSPVLARLGLEAGRYIVVSLHREENVDAPERLSTILDTLEALQTASTYPIVVSTHPRTRARLERLPGRDQRTTDGVLFLKPFGFADWLRLQSDAFCVVSDSGTLTEEATLLGFPAVMLREAHERPEGIDAGVTVMAGIHRERVLQAVALVTRQGRRAPARTKPDHLVSQQVARIILSYVDFVRRTVWREFDP